MLDKYEIVKFMNNPKNHDGNEVYKSEDDCLYAVDAVIQSIRGMMMSMGMKKVQFQGFGAFGAKLTIEDTNFKELMNSIEASNKRLAQEMNEKNHKDNLNLGKKMDAGQEEVLKQIKTLLKKSGNQDQADQLIEQLRLEQSKNMQTLQQGLKREIAELKTLLEAKTQSSEDTASTAINEDIKKELETIKDMIQVQDISDEDIDIGPSNEELQKEVAELKSQMQDLFNQSANQNEAQQQGFYHTLNQQFQETKDLIQQNKTQEVVKEVVSEDKPLSNDILEYERRMRIELDDWLQNHAEWNHDDWLDLMVQLRSQNLGEFTASQEGREFIGNYLEMHRSRLAEQQLS